VDPRVGKPARKPRVCNVKGPEEDEPLVSGRCLSKQDCRRREADKGQNVGELDAEEGRVCRGVSHGAMLHREGCRWPENRHKRRDPDEREANSLVHREPLCADKEDLDREHNEPADEDDGVEMDDEGEGRLVLGDVGDYVTSEAPEDSKPSQCDHKDVEVAVPGMVGRKALCRSAVLSWAGQRDAFRQELTQGWGGRPSRVLTQSAIPTTRKELNNSV
jgi:hypothetical protein